KSTRRSRQTDTGSHTSPPRRAETRCMCSRSRTYKGGHWLISTAGGTRPVWAQKDKELFYLDANGAVTAVPFQTNGATFSPGNPTKLFDGRYYSTPPGRTYDVSPDGQRFLMIKDSASDPNAAPASMVVVLNWVEELKLRFAKP